MVDSLDSNSWRGLRILNSTHDWTYVEYDPTWRFVAPRMQHVELYDNREDPYQLHNLYPTLGLAGRATLAATLSSYWTCAGSSCP
jgi:hypothetical protein